MALLTACFEDRGFQNVERFAKDTILDRDRGEETDDVSMHAARQQDQAFLKRNQANLVGEIGARQLRRLVVELDSVHETRTADIDDFRHLFAQ